LEADCAFINRRIDPMRITVPIGATLAAVCSIAIAACSESPVSPSTTSAPQPAFTEIVSAPTGARLSVREAGLTPADLESRGWTCRAAPFNPNRVTCVHPNTLHPVMIQAPPPPPDRPASISLLVFDFGEFTGTDLLIRSDLYNGQPCQWTGGDYRFIARIGYYECVHEPQGN
jgi:hypothetical protein